MGLQPGPVQVLSSPGGITAYALDVYLEGCFDSKGEKLQVEEIFIHIHYGEFTSF